jgi:hypothetical protein
MPKRLILAAVASLFATATSAQISLYMTLNIIDPLGTAFATHLARTLDASPLRLLSEADPAKATFMFRVSVMETKPQPGMAPQVVYNLALLRPTPGASGTGAVTYAFEWSMLGVCPAAHLAACAGEAAAAMHPPLTAARPTPPPAPMLPIGPPRLVPGLRSI